MAIRFPKMNVAESVVNRILNVAEFDLQRVYPPTQPTMPVEPSVPDPTLAGGSLDMALREPVADLPPVTPADESAIGQGMVLEGLGL